MTTSSTPQSSPEFSGDDARRLDALTARVVSARRAKSAADAAEAEALAEAMEFALARRARIDSRDSRKTDIPVREVAAELAAAVRASDRTIQSRLDDATTLVTRFSATLRSLAAGEIERTHVVTIVDCGDRIDDDTARGLFEEAALELARRETPGRIRPVLKMLAQRIDPIPLQQRHQLAKADADVWVRDLDDGMAQLVALVPVAVAHGIRDRLTQYARAVIEARTAEAPASDTSPAETSTSTETATATATATAHPTPVPDSRSIGEIRADVFSDILLTGHATAAISDASVPEGEAIRAHVQVTIPAATLAGTGTEPAELAGHGPLAPEAARHLAAGTATWTRLFTDSTGCVTGVDRYRAPASLRKLLAARDEHCRFPGCRQPARRCDLDHTVDAALGGATRASNLAHLCRRHHVLKHNSAWTVRQQPGGVLEWTSPAGHTYPDVPARCLEFTTTASPPGAPPPF